MKTLHQSILEQVPEAIVFANTEGQITLWNQGAEDIFGFSKAEALGQTLDLIIPERFRKAHWTGFHEAMKSGHVRHLKEVRITRALHKTKDKLYVSLSFQVIHDDDGKILGAVGVARDTTDYYLQQKETKEYKRV